MMCAGRSPRAKNAPLRAKLFASLPPLVKTTSSGLHDRRLATRLRLASTIRFAGRPAPVRARSIALTVIHCRAPRFLPPPTQERRCAEIQIDLYHRLDDHDLAP